ncbi:MAG: DNA photolyase [Syntrophobacterales bacterium]|nr:DNA photolyase [Syntrophobacterales bacterium]
MRLRRIWVEEAALPYETTRRVLARLPGVPVDVIPHREVLRPRGGLAADWPRQAKETLLLAVQRGPFWRPCPGTPEYICCGYQVLQVGLNCPFDCRYCILQGYLNLPALTVFVNLEDCLRELEEQLASGGVWRLGTGEFGDSLALEELTGLHARLIPLFARQAAAVLEIKSKGRALDPLLPLGPTPRVIFAWSLNPPEVIRELEPKTASLGARLQAAARAAAAGFRLAFHFDPLIWFPGWEAAYRETVDRLARAVPASAAVWISLGALRFPPPLRRQILRRFPASRFAAEEMILAPDGKLRYFHTRRVEMYGRLREWLEAAFPAATLYLCMESPRVWRQVFGVAPDSRGLARRLNAAALGQPPAVTTPASDCRPS